ncbi:MAG: MarR family winged helix-turn-helix transcriptional regulator [Candidatus Dormibacteraceae bacterium]
MVTDPRLIPLIFQASRALESAGDRELAAFGVTGQQAGLLLLTYRGGGTMLSKLAGMMGIDNAALTRLVDRLEAKGLVARQADSHDRRMIGVQLTDTGRELVPRLTPVVHRLESRARTGFSEEEMDQLIGLLSRVLDNTRAQSASRSSKD